MTEPVAEAAPQTAMVTPAEPEAPKPTETVEFWKQQARANEEKFKANADAARRLKEIEDRDLSELQKAQRDREEAIAERDRLHAEHEQLRAADLRKQVALDKGLPATLVARLQGGTVEELAADADALLALMNTPRTPQPDYGQGPRAVSPQSAEDAEYAAYKAQLFPTNQ